jgi:hypothetical protein
VVFIHLVEVVPPFSEKPDPRLEALDERPTVADVPQQEGHGAHSVGGVNVGGVALEHLVVSKPLRLFVGVDVAAQPGEE